jgi:hypothetical protein
MWPDERSRLGRDGNWCKLMRHNWHNLNFSENHQPNPTAAAPQGRWFGPTCRLIYINNKCASSRARPQNSKTTLKNCLTINCTATLEPPWQSDINTQGIARHCGWKRSTKWHVFIAYLCMIEIVSSCPEWRGDTTWMSRGCQYFHCTSSITLLPLLLLHLSGRYLLTLMDAFTLRPDSFA